MNGQYAYAEGKKDGAEKERARIIKIASEYMSLNEFDAFMTELKNNAHTIWCKCQCPIIKQGKECDYEHEPCDAQK